MTTPSKPAATAHPAPLGSPQSTAYLNSVAQNLVHTIRTSRLYDAEPIGVVEQILRRTIRHHLPPNE